MIGADHVNAQFPGTRVGCLRERWTLATRSGGMVAVTRQLVMDPLPPFGLTSLVARATAQRALTSLDDLAAVLQMTAQSSNSVVGALPWRTTPLPQLCASFVRCQNAAAPRD